MKPSRPLQTESCFADLAQDGVVDSFVGTVSHLHSFQIWESCLRHKGLRSELLEIRRWSLLLALKISNGGERLHPPGIAMDIDGGGYRNDARVDISCF